MSFVSGANALTDWIYAKGGPNTDGSVRVRYGENVFQSEERIDSIYMGDGDTYPNIQDNVGTAHFVMYNMTAADIVNDVP